MWKNSFQIDTSPLIDCITAAARNNAKRLLITERFARLQSNEDRNMREIFYNRILQ